MGCRGSSDETAQHRFRDLLALATTAAVGLLGWKAYQRLVRPHVLNWGATPEEVLQALPGDELLPEVQTQTTRAIAVDATPEQVWPWLAQMGPRPRAGVYTYDWIERLLGLDIENSDRLLPGLKDLEVGELWMLGSKGPALAIRAVSPGHHLVLQWHPGGSTWAFVLLRHGQQTRLVSRNRIVGSGIGFRTGMVLMEPGSLVMEREMLRGIKRRAEGLAQSKM